MLFFSCKKNPEPLVELETTEGTIKIRLYEQTPKHRDNFVKLIESGFYNDLLFHRVGKDFFIQTGDPNSKNASKNRVLGSGGTSYSIPAEINRIAYFHKRGAVCAYHTETATDKESNGSQFYIALGRPYTDTELDTLELNEYNQRLDMILKRLIAFNRNKIAEISIHEPEENFKRFQDSLIVVAEEEIKKQEPFLFTPEQREIYTTIGGIPFWDGEYTVFGEIEEGLEVVEKISQKPIGVNARPLEDIRIINTRVKYE